MKITLIGTESLELVPRFKNAGFITNRAQIRYGQKGAGSIQNFPSASEILTYAASFATIVSAIYPIIKDFLSSSDKKRTVIVTTEEFRVINLVRGTDEEQCISAIKKAQSITIIDK